METLKIKFTGTRPMLMHCDILADPLNPFTKVHKAMTVKSKKTDDDHHAIAQSEWRAGLYFNEKLGPVMPGVNIYGSIFAAAKLSKQGQMIKRGVEVVEEEVALQYKGPRDIQGLWDAAFYDARSIVVSGKRVQRYRPIFKDWSFTATFAFDPLVIDPAKLMRCAEDAGKQIGIGDYRPRFGRFSVEEA